MRNLWICVLLFFCLASPAAAETMRVSFLKLAPDSAVNLRCVKGEYKVSIPVPERWSVRKATISVSYVNSANLIAEKSQLVALVNDHPIAQVRLSPDRPEGKMDFSIPVDFLLSGYNNLAFRVAQHYTQNCEQFCAPDLWTNLDFSNSYLEIEYLLKPVPLKLSTVSGFLFDPKNFPQGEVNIITESFASDVTDIAGIISSGVARRFDYRKVVFTISDDIRPGHDNLLIGDSEFVEEFLKRKGGEVTKISAPFLKIMHLSVEKGETDQFHALLVVSGLNMEQVKLAAKTLANMTLPYPGTDEMEVKELDMPDMSSFTGKQVLEPDRLYKLKTLNFSTHTFEGFNPGPLDISFRLPADFFIKQNNYATLTLNYSFGAGLRHDSVLNIKLNGKNVKVIHLKDESGGYIEGYNIELPTYLFSPGTNTITFAPYLNPVAKECDLIQPENYFLTIFDNSTFHFPDMPSFVEMPKIELFMADGFPFTRTLDDYGSMIYLANPDQDTVAAALNLIGLITQRNGYPILGIRTGLDKLDQWKGDIILLSDANSIPVEMLDHAPLKPVKSSSVPYIVSGEWDSDPLTALSRQLSGIGQGSGAVMEFQSPYKTGRSVLLLTAASTSELSALSRALLDPVVRSQCSGGLVLVDLSTNDFKVTAVNVGEKYVTGKGGRMSAVDYYLYRYHYLYYIFFGLLVLFISATLFIYLRKIRRGVRYEKEGSADGD